MRLNLGAFKVEDATHLLSCRDFDCSGDIADYKMKCLILKRMLGGRVKVVVFSDKMQEFGGRVRWVECVDNSRLANMW